MEAGTSRAMVLRRALNGRPKDAWYPDLVGAVPYYPHTEEKWLAKRARLAAIQPDINLVRKSKPKQGVLVGFGGRAGRHRLAEISQRAAEEADKVMTTLEEFDALYPDLNLGDDPQVKLAFRTAVEIMIAAEVDPKTGKIIKRLYSGSDRIKAANLLATFLREKPVSKVDAKITKAEDFLSMLAGHAPLTIG